MQAGLSGSVWSEISFFYTHFPLIFQRSTFAPVALHPLLSVNCGSRGTTWHLMEENKDTFSALFFSFFLFFHPCTLLLLRSRSHHSHLQDSRTKIETKHLCSESSRPESHWVSQYWVPRLLRESESASPTQAHTHACTKQKTICDWVRIVYTSARHWKIDEPI